ncbi:MAG: rhomboid family intramembrane serine protease [Bacteroidota bacterium]
MEEQKKRIINSLSIPLQFILLIWAIHFFQIITGLDFGRYGIFPRELFGLRGILFSPLIHSDLRHLLSNSAPMFLLSVMIVYFYPRVANRSMIMIYLLTGLSVWLLGRRVFHIGASGVVYGLVSFVFWMGIFRRSLKSIILALIVTILYSGYFLGILPNQEGISWESHLLGGIVGIFVAYWFKEQIEADEEPPPPSWANEDNGQDYFLDRDIFEKTKAEREQERNENRLW